MLKETVRRIPLALCFAAALTSCSSPPASISDPGPAFVRIGSDPSIWYLPAGTATYCLVADPTQMNVFGGFGRVKQVDAGATITGRRLDGTCRYPDGVYEVAGTAYRLHGDTICRESRPERHATTVPAGTALGVSRRDLGRCASG